MSKSVGDVEMLLEEWLNLLDITDNGTYIKIKAKQYLGSEVFSKIASTIRQVGGEYISAGKESHFRIPKSTVDGNTKMSLSKEAMHLQKIKALVEQILQELKEAGYS